MYTAYVLTDHTRAQLLKMFPPKYERNGFNNATIAHHVTEEFGVPADTELPEPVCVEIIGHLDTEDGLEVLVVTVNGEYFRKDNNLYHITWSLDPEKYKPVDSNKALQETKWARAAVVNLATVPCMLW